MVGQVSALVEWSINLPRPQLEGCRDHQLIYRCLGDTGLWSILQRGVVTGHLIRDFPCDPFSGRNCLPSLQAACTWGHLLQGQRITVHCDNMAIVQSWSNQSTRHPGILHLLWTLFFITAKHSFMVCLVHLPGKLIRIADALSRNQLSLFSALAPQANPQANTSTSRAGRTLCHQMGKLLCRALAPSTLNTYQTRIKRCYDFCSTPPPETTPGYNSNLGTIRD